jgi:hypothetical protein
MQILPDGCSVHYTREKMCLAESYLLAYRF